MRTRSAHQHQRRGERGSAAIVVLVLLFLIVAFAAGNTVTLRSLKRELQLVEQRQLTKYGAAAVTNSVTPATTGATVSRPSR